MLRCKGSIFACILGAQGKKILGERHGASHRILGDYGRRR
jgi:hypothetical protein